jgi:hypothetical protein
MRSLLLVESFDLRPSNQYIMVRVIPSCFRFANFFFFVKMTAPEVWWSECLASDSEIHVRFPALSDFLRSSGSVTGSTQPREYS